MDSSLPTLKVECVRKEGNGKIASLPCICINLKFLTVEAVIVKPAIWWPKL